MGLEGLRRGNRTCPFVALKDSMAIPEYVLRPIVVQCLIPVRSCSRLEMSIAEKGPLCADGFSKMDVFPSKKVFLVILEELKFVSNSELFQLAN